MLPAGVQGRVLGMLPWRRARPGQAASLTLRWLHAERQQHRGLVRVEGQEAAEFLQGLVTNDMGHLEGGAAGMYCLLLNRQGRILHDSIIYRHSPATFLLECDAARAGQLERHLRMHRVRRRLVVEDVTNDLSVWCVFDPEPDLTRVPQIDAESLYMNPRVEGGAPLQLEGDSRDVLVIQDPRMRQLGHRLVVPAGMASLRALLPGVEHEGKEFKALRYRLGVGEGSEELPPTKCLPLEANCDYLHGVSFHKGCYVGQELTARTFHTGVVRKRLLPLIFPKDPSGQLPQDASVVDERGRAVGKVRACLGHLGLGLLRVEECLGAKSLTVEGLAVETFRPPWWPFLASKNKANQ